MTKAGFGLRLLAGLLDLLLFLAIYVLIALVLRSRLAQRFISVDRAWISVFIGNSLLLVYGLSEVLWAATPGKRMLRLRIAKADGLQAARGALLLRYVLKYSPRIFGLLDGLAMSHALRRLAVWAGLPFFRQHPVEFITARVVGELLLLALGVGFFFVLLPRRQALHDWLTGVCVFRYDLPLSRRGFDAIPVAGVAEMKG